MAHIEIAASPKVAEERTRNGLYTSKGKRILDILLACFLLPVVAPVVAGLCVLVRFDGGPGLYAHTRVGRNGKLFRCWKIRSMRQDADYLLAAYLASDPHAAAEWDRTQKLQSDPRITRVGRVLRRTSLDELPQIWNVLCGEMSFVGPRPVTAEELSRYGALQTAYLSMRPGITGLWQVRGRENGCYDERLAMDSSYAASVSLVQDLILICQTASVLVRPTGR
jgi:lipopolysaccharide/colanic/teichoic acid biosynthesis glycosyltransferase